MPTPTASVKVNPLTGALIDPIAATFASANGFLTGGTSDAKESVVCATTANGTLATAFENGDTVDGITLATGNRILIKNQSAPAENGIYTVNASGAPTRATDFDSWTEIVGAFVSVESGTVNAGTQWLCNVVSGGTLGTTAINFVVPQNYVNLTTNQIVAGSKHFATGSTIGGVEISKDTASPAVNGSIQFLEDDSIFALSAGAGSLWLHTTGNTDVTFPLSGTLLSTADIGVTVQAYNANLTTWAGITPGANVDTFLATPSGANLASALTSVIPITKGGTGADTLQSEKFALLREEFASGGNTDQQIGQLGWRTGNIGGTGGSGGFTLSTASHPGQFTITTASAYTASVSDCRGIWLAPSAVAPCNLNDAQEIRFTFSLASIANVKVKIGMTNDVTTYDSARGDYIGFDTSLGETNFMGVTKDGGAETRTSTGVAAGTGWFTAKIRYISATSIGFSISSAGGAFSNEITVAQTAGGSGRFPCVFIGNLAAAAKSITVDFFSYYFANITR